MSAAEAAAILVRHWRDGSKTPGLPDALRPRDRREGYAIQAEFAAAVPGPLPGWKIAATSSGGQRHIGVEGPIAGRVLPGTLLAPGATIALGANAMRVAEPEFAFRLGTALPARAAPYSEAELLAAIASLHLSIEIPDSRYSVVTEAGGAQIIAENACAHQFIFGPAVSADWRALYLAAHRVHATIGTRFEREGFGRNVLGHPITALTWLANELSGLGLGLEPGHIVTTGTCMIPPEIEPGDAVRFDYGVLGSIGCCFTA